MPDGPKFTHKYHPQPRLSANQVADYLTANATGRQRILRDAKFPPTLLTIRYEDARSAVVAHLAGGKVDILDQTLQILHRKASHTVLSDYAKQNCNLCIDAIESFQSAESGMNSANIVFRTPHLHTTKLKVSGVNISVSVDLAVEKADGKGVKSAGAAILIFSKPKKNDAELESRCKAVALLVYELLKSQLKPVPNLDTTLCMAIDIFKAKIYRAKAHQKLLYKSVEASCSEVTTMWPSVQPPPDYNGPPIPK